MPKRKQLFLCMHLIVLQWALEAWRWIQQALQWVQEAKEDLVYDQSLFLWCMCEQHVWLWSLISCNVWTVADPGFMDRGADILLPPPAPPLLLPSLLLPLIPLLFFLDVQARRGGWRTPSPHARSAPAWRPWRRRQLVFLRSAEVACCVFIAVS